MLELDTTPLVCGAALALLVLEIGLGQIVQAGLTLRDQLVRAVAADFADLIQVEEVGRDVSQRAPALAETIALDFRPDAILTVAAVSADERREAREWEE